MTQLGRDAEPDLRAEFERLTRASVLVLGDATLERRVLGRFDGAPVSWPFDEALDAGPDAGPRLASWPEFRLGREEVEPGGGAGVVRALARIGVATAFVCVLGDDLAGAELTALIGAQANVEPWLLVDAVKATTTETRYVAWAPSGGEATPEHHAVDERVILRTIREDGRPINDKLRERMLRIAGDAMMATSVTVLCDRGHGTLDVETTTAILARSRLVGRRIVADLERMRGIELRFRGFDALIALAVDLPAREIDAAAAAACMRLDAEAGSAVLFLPEGGAVIADRDGTAQLDFAPATTVSAAYADFVAAFAGSLAIGMSARHALAVGAYAVTRADRAGSMSGPTI